MVLSLVPFFLCENKALQIVVQYALYVMIAHIPSLEISFAFQNSIYPTHFLSAKCLEILSTKYLVSSLLCSRS